MIEQPGVHRHEIAIVGAGFGGIGMAIRLKQAGWHDFVVIEQADDVGGTWRDNTYPGSACDIPSHLYSLSFAPSADWSRRYPQQAELQAYLQSSVERFALRPHLRLGARLDRARFDTEEGVWQLDVSRGPGIVVRVLVMALGMLHRPALPALPGLATFRGVAFHSARWNHAVDLNNQRVAVIGTGASAAQFVPRVAERARNLTLFQRTPAWVLPKRDPPYRAWQRWALRRVPLLRRVLRTWLYWSHEIYALAFAWIPALMAGAERRARSYAKRQLHDDDLRAAVTPLDRMGCKRIILSNDFLPALERSNVRLVTAPVAEVVPEGLLTADGARHAADVLIFATGFQAADPLGPVRVVGRDGALLSDVWRDGMRARLGLAVAGFPNLFLLGGPNTGLGHNSVVFMLEAQIAHVLRCLRWLRRRKSASIEVRPEAEAAFTRRLDTWMQRTIWLTGCRSWYLDRSGRNTALWPGSSFGYWLRTLPVLRRHYQVASAPGDCFIAPARVEEAANADQGSAGQHA